MSNYLVVAHQTATSPVLLEKLQEIAREDPSVTFTLLVPATRVSHLLTWNEGESYAIAFQAGQEAKEMLEKAGLRVAETIVGDESPVQAIDETLRPRAERPVFDAIVISTLPPGVSRWLKLDVHNRARQFGLPVVSVISPRATVEAGARE